jgi:hypothetical protein
MECSGSFAALNGSRSWSAKSAQILSFVAGALKGWSTSIVRISYLRIEASLGVPYIGFAKVS